MSRRVLFLILTIFFVGLLLGGGNTQTAKTARADELLPHDLLTVGDKFSLIITTNQVGVESVTYHYEYAD